MAENETDVVDWSTAPASNSPADANDLNSTTADEYAGLANYFRDVKAAIRSESLDMGFDPSTTYLNGTAAEKFAKNTGDDELQSFKVIGVNLGADFGIVEGQSFFLEVYDGSSLYVYYSGYVLALDLVSSDTVVYVSGLTRWKETSSSQDGSGLSELAARDDFVDGDKEDFDNVKSSVSFSAYPPPQNLGWSLSTDDANAADIYIGSLPWNRQFGSFYVPYNEKTVAISLPHQEPDNYYTISLTPTNVAGTGISAKAFSVNMITKARSFFVVEFISEPNSATGGDTEAIYWDWEIHRDY
jgi:hypothetical protein